MEEYSKIYEEAIQVLDTWYEKQYEQAINSWGNLYAKDSQAFIAHQPLFNFIKDRQKESIEHDYFKEDLEFLISSYKDGNLELKKTYPAFNKLLFQIGLSPQHWIEFNALDKALSHWETEASNETFIPYSAFMLGLVHAYFGKYRELSLIHI